MEDAQIIKLFSERDELALKENTSEIRRILHDNSAQYIGQ